MSNPFFDQPILNSPYTHPSRHWELDKNGQPTQRTLDGRRPTDFTVPIPKPKRVKAPKQAALLLMDEEQLTNTEQEYHKDLINRLRKHIDEWRKIPNPQQWNVTPTTAKLLQHWRHHNFQSQRPFFCQVEAVETAIWLAEVANKNKEHKDFLNRLADAQAEANPLLFRIALKLATGAGKTTVMAMLIAWQTLNAVRHPKKQGFTKGFLLVAPGITIRDRLRVLLPNDPNSYYRSREIVPFDMLPDLQQAKIVITNYHAFKLREKSDISKGTRNLLEGRGGSLQTIETEGQMLQRVIPELMGFKNILVINDEAHHCYREKPKDPDDLALKGDDKKEAEKNNEAARLWISGLEAIQRKIGIHTVFDLSATPFFLRGSGYAEGTMFPWVMSDFSLMDAIECGIVKLPRVPVADNIPGGDVPKFRNLWDHIGSKMSKSGRGKSDDLDPLKIPAELQTALAALYGHYLKTFEAWQNAKMDGIPPCMIVVCNNTANSKLIFDYISGFHRQKEDGTASFENGRLPLFRNYDDSGSPLSRPYTLLIDSEQLESGDALDSNFRSAAHQEIELFRREIKERTGDTKAAEEITDQQLLREVMNTVGKKGRLGESIRCVVSVSMLTEGWDCLDASTEILAHNGWAKIGQVSRGDLIYSLNRDTGNIEVVPVLEYGERTVRQGERMVRFKSQHLDIRVTEGHEFHLKYRNPRAGGQLSSGWLTKKAYEMVSRRSPYALPLSAECRDFPGVPLSDDEIRFIAWFMTDGGFSQRGVVICQSKPFRHEIRELLSRLGLDCTERLVHPGSKAYPNSKPISTFRIPKGTHHGSMARNGWNRYHDYLDKMVAPALHDMTRRQFLLFWEELLKGDGEKQKNRSGWLWCAEKAQADAYTQMAVLRGFAAASHPEITNAGKTVYRVTVRDTRWITSDPNDQRSTRIFFEDPTPNEVVWCVQNRNSTLITRRNGKLAIVGNCNNVTHILGVRAFGTQLLCEQVVGRALRRFSYELNEHGLFDVEYADVLGIPFNFTAKPVIATAKPPNQTIQICAIGPERDPLEIRFPRVVGYRVQLPEERLEARFSDDSTLVLTPDLVGPCITNNSGIIGESVNLGIEHLDKVRFNTILYEITKYLLEAWRDEGGDPKLYLFGQLKRIARQWLEHNLVCKGGTKPAQLLYKELADMACKRITDAITSAHLGTQTIRALLDPYNPTGSSKHIHFNTSKASRWQTDPRKSHINWIVLDSDWEGELCRVVEAQPHVHAYVKNQGLGLEVPYQYGSIMRKYIPDFIVQIDDGRGKDDLLHLIVEIKGYRKEDAKEKKSTMENNWIPGVNALGTYGRWAFVEITDVYAIQQTIEDFIENARAVSRHSHAA